MLPGTSVQLLDQFGALTVNGLPGLCFNDAHIVAVSPALAGLADVNLSNWSCSVHEAFDGFPASSIPLAIADGIGCPTTYVSPVSPAIPPVVGDGGTGGTFFEDGRCETPYIVARGASSILCGNGTIQATEQCDDGNTTGGDDCSATCTIEVCGNSTLDVGEACDDGNTLNGDGCSAACTIEGTHSDKSGK